MIQKDALDVSNGPKSIDADDIPWDTPSSHEILAQLNVNREIWQDVASKRQNMLEEMPNIVMFSTKLCRWEMMIPRMINHLRAQIIMKKHGLYLMKSK